MIARVTAKLPCPIAVPIGEALPPKPVEIGDFSAVFWTIARSGTLPVTGSLKSIKVDGRDAMLADQLVIIIAKKDASDFSRNVSQETHDPPDEVVSELINYFVSRYRYATSFSLLLVRDVDQLEWHLDYLNNDMTQLKQEDGKYRGLGRIKKSVSMVSLNITSWNSAMDLPSGFVPPQWNDLLIDATGALPHIGSAIVLAATSLEVFISEVLGKLQESLQTIDTATWRWIHDRGDYYKEPSTEEQFDDLLKILCGHSLKENADLWSAFKNLRQARNSFVHSGVARIGKKPPFTIVDQAMSLDFIGKARAITQQIRDWIPENIRWPLAITNVKMEFLLPIIEPPTPPSEIEITNI